MVGEPTVVVFLTGHIVKLCSCSQPAREASVCSWQSLCLSVSAEMHHLVLRIGDCERSALNGTGQGNICRKSRRVGGGREELTEMLSSDAAVVLANSQ